MSCKVFTILFTFAALHSNAQTMSDSMSMNGMKMSGPGMPMSSIFSPNIPMSRDGSGTSWQPDESPMMMYMKMSGKNMYMFHGFIYLRYTAQDFTNENDRGGNQFDAPNMFMFMWAHSFDDKNLLSFISMFSLDPLTVGASGYPLLLQTGESYKGQPLVDRQHPHDLFSELAINYTHSFSEDLDVNLYVGYPGEPALGPGTFMHRLSAMNDPDAPLSHHWQDATHITFGVSTIGIRYKIFKAEGSIFTGREPDENRYNFDKPQFDSYSYRISANPGKNFSLQFSQGFIKSPEAAEPTINVIRTTASILHTKTFSVENFIASSLVWGMNHNSDRKNLQSVLLESNLKLTPLSIYGRYEFVQKDAEELNLPQFDNDSVFNINTFTIGLNKVLFSKWNTDVSLGWQGTINFPGTNLKTVYGNRPLSAEIYLKIAPSLSHGH